jgi:hypothetical protein
MRDFKLALLIFIAIICNGLSGQALPPEKIGLKDLIINCLDYTDFNPIHKTETDKLINEFRSAINSDKIFSSGQNLDRIDSTFNDFYNYTTASYEDSPDYRRAKIRRMYCFAILALYSDLDKATTFVEFSKLSLIETIDNPETEFMQNQMLGLYWLEIFIAKEHNDINPNDLVKIEDYLNKNGTLVSESNYNYSQVLLKDIKKDLN